MAQDGNLIEKVKDYYNKARSRSQAERYTYERDWFRNVLYYLGIQWIIYSPQTRKWRPRKIARWVPRPVTNKFYTIANTIMQVLSQKDPDTRARPGSDDPDDVAAAQVADKVLPVILDEAGADEARRIAAAWTVLTGTAFLHSSYDNDPNFGTTFVQHVKCQQCGNTFAPDMAGPGVPMQAPPGIPPQANPISSDLETSTGGAGPRPLPVGSPASLPMEESPQMSDASCPQCQSPMLAPATDETGAQIGENLPNGKNRLEVFSPFEVFADLECRDMSELQQILVRRRYPLDVIKRKFNRPDLEGDNNSNVGGSIGLNLLRAIAYAAGNAMYGTGIASGRNIGDDQSITVDQLWVRPNADFPEGLVATFANEDLLDPQAATAGLPDRDLEGKPVWTWQMIKFDHVPGRFFGKTPMDDVAPKQEQRNKLESLIQLIVTRSANPVWLVAKGLGITEITGEPGQILEGNWAMDPKLRPERVPGENIPTSLIAWLEKIDKDMEDVAGCITGDTIIPCLDGKERSMSELAEQFPFGGMWVYGFDREQMRIVPAEIKRAWKTKTDKCVRVLFKEGTHVDCTADHPFLTWDRGYVRADELRVDEPIVPLILRRQPVNYISVIQPTESKLEEVHRMVSHELFELSRDSRGALHVHHKDKCKTNNLPKNLQVMTPGDHIRISEPKGWRKDPNNHSTDKQAKRSQRRWIKIPKGLRSKAVNAMLEARSKQLASATAEELSASARKGWETRRSNHRVSGVIELDGLHDVYDLTTSVHNFGTSAGVFVHNTFDVLRGSAPTGVTAGTALRLLLERAVTRFTPVINRLERTWEQVCTDQLMIFQQNASEDRIAKIQGPGNTWEISRFSKADLQGSVDVVVEAGSMIPKSLVGEQAAIQDLTTGGVIMPQNPQTQYKILQKYGMTDLLGDVDQNIRYAQRENWHFVNEGKAPQIGLFDAHLVHLMVHKEWLLTSDFELMQPQQQQIWRQHMLDHQMAAMPMPPPMSAGPPGAEAPGGEGKPNGKAQSEVQQDNQQPPMPGGPV